MIARRPYKTANFSKPPLDLRPRPPCAKGWERYHPLGHYPPIPDTPGFRMASSYHETGHVVAYVHFDIPFTRVWMEHPKTGKARVTAAYRPAISEPGRRQYYENNAVLSMTGPEAERRYAPRSYVAIGAGYEGTIHGRVQILPESDLDYFWRYVFALASSYDQREAVRRELMERSKLLVKELWPQIQIVAKALFKRGVLSERQVRELMCRPPRNKERYRSKEETIRFKPTKPRTDLCYE
jgi:hypothetical protein